MRAEVLTTREIAAYKNLVALIPFGAFEQHGPHLPLATDSMIATAITERVEKALAKKVIVFPTIWFGDSLEHNGFAGTLSVSALHLIPVLSDLFEWLDRSGFTKAVLYNTHGGNVNLAGTAAEEFSRTHRLKVKSMYAYTELVKKQ